MADSGKAYKRSEYLELFGTGIEKMAWGLLYKFVLANLAYKVMSLVMAKTILQVLAYSYAYGKMCIRDSSRYAGNPATKCNGKDNPQRSEPCRVA